MGSRAVGALLLGACAVSGLMWLRCSHYELAVQQLREELAAAAVVRIEGDIEARRMAATVLAARARVAIAELRRHAIDPEVGEHVRTLLARIEEALR